VLGAFLGIGQQAHFASDPLLGLAARAMPAIGRIVLPSRTRTGISRLRRHAARQVE
jgi:hypothetical protein